MPTRSLVIAALAVAFGFAAASGVQAESKNKSHNEKGATSHQVSSGTGQAAKKKKQHKPAVSDIKIIKQTDKSSATLH